MSKIEEAKQILAGLGLPEKQQNERSALTLLALCNLKENDQWDRAEAVSMSVVGNRKKPRYEGILRFVATHYDKQYAENSRETIRRQTLHQFVQAGIVEHNPENPGLPTNSKDNHYRLSQEALEVVKSYKTGQWEQKVHSFKGQIGSLRDKYLKPRKTLKTTIQLDKRLLLEFSPGKHNEVQAAVIEEFMPRFAPKSHCLYIGDTAKKDLYMDKDALKKLKIPIDQHSKLPDIILYDKKHKWLFLIEVVTSHGPMSPKRVWELEEMLKKCKAGKVYVSAFPDFKEFKRHTSDIAWETEVWIASNPDHMIHFNGDRFMGPR